MKWSEEKKGEIWRSGAYSIRRTERFKRSAIVPESMKSLGPDIYHCYRFDEDTKENIYVAQTSDLIAAQKKLEKLSKS